MAAIAVRLCDRRPFAFLVVSARWQAWAPPTPLLFA